LATQVPPFKQGFEAQTVLQLDPEKPAAHAQVNPVELDSEAQVPPLRQGFGKQGLVSFEGGETEMVRRKTKTTTTTRPNSRVPQRGSEYPGEQAQLNSVPLGVQVPPFSQGEEEQAVEVAMTKKPPRKHKHDKKNTSFRVSQASGFPLYPEWQ